MFWRSSWRQSSPCSSQLFRLHSVGAAARSRLRPWPRARPRRQLAIARLHPRRRIWCRSRCHRRGPPRGTVREYRPAGARRGGQHHRTQRDLRQQRRAAHRHTPHAESTGALAAAQSSGPRARDQRASLSWRAPWAGHAIAPSSTSTARSAAAASLGAAGRAVGRLRRRPRRDPRRPSRRPLQRAGARGARQRRRDPRPQRVLQPRTAAEPARARVHPCRWPHAADPVRLGRPLDRPHRDHLSRASELPRPRQGRRVRPAGHAPPRPRRRRRRAGRSSAAAKSASSPTGTRSASAAAKAASAPSSCACAATRSRSSTCTVVYERGPPDELEVRSKIRDGGETRPLDLRGERRAIDRVELSIGCARPEHVKGPAHGVRLRPLSA